MFPWEKAFSFSFACFYYDYLKKNLLHLHAVGRPARVDGKEFFRLARFVFIFPWDYVFNDLRTRKEHVH